MPLTSHCLQITIPAKPNFFIEPGKMEFGIGHHGEPGVEVSERSRGVLDAGATSGAIILQTVASVFEKSV